MAHAPERAPYVEQPAEQLSCPGTCAALAAKRALDLLLAMVMLVALLPLFALVGLALTATGTRAWLERDLRVGRGGERIRLLRFRELPGGLGRALQRLGVRDLPLLVCVLAGRLSFVGPRAGAPEAEFGHPRPRRLMAPGLTGPAQRWAGDGKRAGELDDAYVTEWSLWGDLRMLAGLRSRAPRPAPTGMPD
jgi:lipopolysaccharide/colanic/teichoic acid biosynthesis glycosyltransferase